MTVLERIDQPLAVDAPLLREIRAAMGKAVENGRGSRPVHAHPGVAALQRRRGARVLLRLLRPRQPRPAARRHRRRRREHAPGREQRRRQFYLGIDFIRKGTRLPKLQIWQEQLLDAYPHLADLALEPGPETSTCCPRARPRRPHPLRRWVGRDHDGQEPDPDGLFELLGLHVKANPKYGSEKKGQPTTFYATLAHEPIRLNCELKHVDVVLSPDPNVFRHSNPLAGPGAGGGVFVIQSDQSPQDLWSSLPTTAQREIREKGIRSSPGRVRDRRRARPPTPSCATACRAPRSWARSSAPSPLLKERRAGRGALFEGIRRPDQKKFGHLGERVVEDNLRVIRRGYDEVASSTRRPRAKAATKAKQVPVMPRSSTAAGRAPRASRNTGRFWEQVCHLYKTGEDGIADPFAAISAMPAATSTIRDMTDVRFEVPEFHAEKCTGCSQCWMQCPDAAIPGLVNTVEEVLDAAIARGRERPVARPRSARRRSTLAREVARRG